MRVRAREGRHSRREARLARLARMRAEPHSRSLHSGVGAESLPTPRSDAEKGLCTGVTPILTTEPKASEFFRRRQGSEPEAPRLWGTLGDWTWLLGCIPCTTMGLSDIHFTHAASGGLRAHVAPLERPTAFFLLREEPVELRKQNEMPPCFTPQQHNAFCSESIS